MSAGVPDALAPWDRDVLLKDGTVARIRPICPDDEPGWRRFYAGLSEQSIYQRFFGPHPHPSDAEIRHFVTVDYAARMAFVVEQHGDIIGIGRYELERAGTAEVAFLVDDALQGRGIATLLLEYLVGYAGTQGIHRFVADTLAYNTAMLGVFRRAGFQQQSSTDAGVTRVVLDLSFTPAVQQRVDADAWRASVASLGHILAPSSIAVVGVSRTGTGVGSEILANLQNGGYRGPLFAVNPGVVPHESDGISWRSSIGACAGPVSLAIIAVPVPAVPETVDACAAAGVGGLIIVTAGFAEAGADGARLQADVVARAHHGGVRIVGPNCLGIINTAPGVSMNATFAAHAAVHGHLALGSQSGALGIALLEQTRVRDVGVSSFVSLGNHADIGTHDLLCYWSTDATTHVILLYLEAFRDPLKFFDVARIVTRVKPVIVMKSGRTVVGARAAASHSAALASSDRAADTLFAQAGVIRAGTLEEMLALATLLDHSPVPRGPRVAIVSNAGGAGVLAADAADEHGLTVVALSEATRQALGAIDAAAAALGNPVDLGAGADADRYGAVLTRLAACGEVDAIVAIHAHVAGFETDDFVAMAAEAAWREGIPLVAVTLGVDPRGHADVARFAFPEAAVAALARVVRYGQFLAADPGEAPSRTGIDAPAAAALVDRVLGADGRGRWLDPAETGALLAAYGIPMTEFGYVRSTADAVAAARAIGFPVALKAEVAGVVHKLDAGAVVLGLTSVAAVQRAVREFRRRFGPSLHGIMVQRMGAPGVELLVGAVRDPAFGPLVVYGTGGTDAELYGDQQLRLAPLTDAQAAELVRAPRGARLLEGGRGRAPADIAAVTDILGRISQVVADLPDIAEIECNPVIARPDGARAVDARVRVVRSDPGVPSWIRTVSSGRDG